MKKKTYTKPEMAAERFEPQEYCEACDPKIIDAFAGWFIPKNQILEELYNDKDGNGRGGFITSEQITINYSSRRIPTSGNLTTIPPAAEIGSFYTEMGTLLSGFRYSGAVSPVYKYTYNGTTYYFKGYTEVTEEKRNFS